MHKRRIVLLAHNIRSLWNVGSFFRSADAFAVEKIYLCGYTGVPPRKEITKTAIGADEWVPWQQEIDPVTVAKRLRKDGWHIAALELAPHAIALHDYHPHDRVCLMVGHELNGVPPELLTLCDDIIQIPMLGNKESLNVAVAAGIALHHLRTASLERSA